MKIGLSCKFCQCPITVQADQDFLDLCGKWKIDGIGWIKRLACCDYCAGLREERRYLNHRISKGCWAFSLMVKPSAESLNQVRESLTILCKRYCRMIGRWHRKEGSIFDESMVDSLMAAPLQCGDVLSRCWKVFDEWQAQGEFAATAEPETKEPL